MPVTSSEISVEPLVHIPFKRGEEITGTTAGAGAKYSGAATFTRASTGTYIDPLDGLVKTAAVNTPRYEKMSDGGVGILLEGASTNIALNSNNLNPTGVAAPTTVVANNTPGMIGIANNATTITFAATAGWQVYKGISGLTVGTTYTISFFVKLGSATNLSWYLNNAISANSMPSSHRDEAGLSTTSFTRVQQTFVASSSGAINVHLGHTNSETNSAPQSNGTVFFSGIVVEALPFASSYIPTAGTAVTRAEEILSMPLLGNMPDRLNSMTVSSDIDTVGDAVNQCWFTFDANLTCRAFVGSLFSANRFYHAGTINTNGLGIDLRNVHKFAVSANLSKNTISIDGNINSIGDGTSLGTDTFSSFRIGSNINGTGYHLFGHIRDFKIFDKALTDAEMSAL